MRIVVLHFTIVFCFLSIFIKAQNIPICGQNTLYQAGTGGCIWQRVSASNTIFSTGCPNLPTNAIGLAIGTPFSFNAPSQCYWTVGANGNYHYYTGTTWVDTGHSAGGNGFTNPGAGSTVIYNIDNSGQVSVYNGNGNAVIITTISAFSPTTGVLDIAADQFNNFYVLTANSPQVLSVYNSQAVLTCTYPVTGADVGGGLAISDGMVHLQTWNLGYYVGSLSSGTINFSYVGPIYCNTNDLASCTGDAGIFGSIVASPAASLSCLNPSITLSSNGTNVSATYTWSGPGIIGSTSSSSIQVNAVGVYTCAAIDCAGNTRTSTVNVGYNSVLPALVAAQSNTVFCQGSSAAITLSVTGYTNYQWSPSIGLSANTGSVVVANPSVTTTYTVNASINSCQNQTLITLVSVPLHTPAVAASNPSLCVGAFCVLYAVGANTYTWLPMNTIGGTVNVLPTSTTVYTVLSSDQYGCNGKNTQTVSVFQYPNLSVTASDVEICSTESLVLTGSGAQTYTLQPGNLNGSTHTLMPTSTTVYILSGNNWQCASSKTIGVQVHPLPQINIASTKSVICSGESVKLTASGANSYTWSSGQVTSTISVAPIQTINYNVSGTDQNGCTNITSYQLLVNECTGISKTNVSTAIALYPNPSHGAFTIEISDEKIGAHMEVYNVIGAKVLTQVLNANKTLISAEHLSPGMYVISIKSGDNAELKRLVVE